MLSPLEPKTRLDLFRSNRSVETKLGSWGYVISHQTLAGGCPKFPLVLAYATAVTTTTAIAGIRQYSAPFVSSAGGGINGPDIPALSGPRCYLVAPVSANEQGPAAQRD
jgi:hypothetical protein